MEPPNSRVKELRDAAAGKQYYTNDWMQNNYTSPTYQQQQQRPPSVISNISNMSEMSNISIGGLSVNTECDMWIQQQYSSRASKLSMENYNPIRIKEKMTVLDIVRNLQSTDFNSQAAAIRELESAVKVKKWEEVWPNKKDLQMIIAALFEVLIPRNSENENIIRKVLEILHNSISMRKSRVIAKIFLWLNTELMNGQTQFQVQNPSSIYEIVMKRVIETETKYDTIAMMLFVYLCCKPYLMRYIFSQGSHLNDHIQRIQNIIIDFSIQNLQSQNLKPKNKGFLVTIIKNLSTSNRLLKFNIINLDIIRIFFDIIKNEEMNEDLLWPTIQTLNIFCMDPTNGDRFVKLGGAQLLCHLLIHPSTRLLHEILGCMQVLADLPALENQEMKESIRLIVQLIGSSDITIVERSTGTLRNIGLHNKMNKVHMVKNGVTNSLFALLKNSAQQFITQQPNPNIRMIILSIYENCFSILYNVTAMGSQDIKESAVEACRIISENQDSAYALFYYFNVGNLKCRKLAVAVMKRVIETMPHYVDHFINLRGPTNDPLPILLLKRAVESLGEWTNSEKMKNEFEKTTKEKEIEQKDHEDIVKRSVGLLSFLCRIPQYYNYLKPLLENGNFNPFQWLSHEMNEIILLEWISFIISIYTIENTLRTCCLYKLLRQTINAQVFIKDLQDRRQNPQIQEMLTKIMELDCQQKFIMGQS